VHKLRYDVCSLQSTRSDFTVCSREVALIGTIMELRSCVNRFYFVCRSFSSRALYSPTEKLSSAVAQNISQAYVASDLKLNYIQPSPSQFSRASRTILASVPDTQKSPLLVSRGPRSGELSQRPLNFPATLKDVNILECLYKEAIELGNCEQNESSDESVDVISKMYCSSILKKRRKKMNRHKYRKWRKRMRFVRRALKK